MPWRKYISAPYLKWPFWLAISIFWVGSLAQNTKHGRIYWELISFQVADLALFLLVFSVFLALLRKIFPQCSTLVRILPLRKSAGILGIFTTLYSVVFQIFQAGPNPHLESFFSPSLWAGSSLTVGSICFMMGLGMFWAGTELLLKKMGMVIGFWTQKIVHLLFILTALHAAFIQEQVQVEPLIILGVYVWGYMILWIKRAVFRTHPHEGLAM